jgi:hypothetical protein
MQFKYIALLLVWDVVGVLAAPSAWIFRRRISSVLLEVSNLEVLSLCCSICTNIHA